MVTPIIEPCKKWIKKIDMEADLNVSQFPYIDSFKKVADITIDNDIKHNGTKKRQTVIKFNPCITLSKWNVKREWIYLFTINSYHCENWWNT